jgi:hypothetical protein
MSFHHHNCHSLPAMKSDLHMMALWECFSANAY